MEERVEILKSDLEKIIGYLNELKETQLWKVEEFRFGHREEFFHLKEFIERLKDERNK